VEPLIVAGDLPADICDTLLDVELLAVDTETSGLSWDRDRLDLCQVFSPATGAVLVHQVTTRPPNLAAVLGSPMVRKVFHHAPFDLKFLRAQWGVGVTNIACTKAASKLVSPSEPAEKHSLRSLLSERLNISVAKGQVRTSDWSQPLLSAEQISYATADVSHLHELLAVLEHDLDVAGLSAAYSEVCRYMPVAAELEVRRIPNPLDY
jgi:ribonuclease D